MAKGIAGFWANGKLQTTKQNRSVRCHLIVAAVNSLSSGIEVACLASGNMSDVGKALQTVGQRAEVSWKGYNAPSLISINQGVASEAYGSALFVETFANVTVVDTAEGLVLVDTAEGLVLVDTGSSFYQEGIYNEIRKWSTKPIHTIIYTHGHVDHVSGIGKLESEAKANGHPPIRVIAHEKVSERFDRYKLTKEFNSIINRRQFSLEKGDFFTQFRYPDVTYEKELKIEVGGVPVHLKHERGETDDATWVYFPTLKLICAGDLFIWACPNCGNPQKAQRYPLEWENALRNMASVDAELMFPGHGSPIISSQRIKQALNETADFLRSIITQSLKMINEGKSLNYIIHNMNYPTELMQRPYLQPTYDEPEFIVHNMWRLYAGWYEQNPAYLKPASEQAVAQEWLRVAGGDIGKIVRRAQDLAEKSNFRVACELIEIAHQAKPEDEDIQLARAIIYRNRAKQETSLMAKAIYNQVGNKLLGLSEQDLKMKKFFDGLANRAKPKL